ncbi:Short integuments 2, mitochondrial [Schistosoma haematobium]|uniref:Short integuments 2, mitochondrial n=1 Tax=Schistosoma haematobium TaxID=6185 RepID=A0A922IIB2_SCHHA|nr:Short integuments 2, mitochondrial [Schistosoma haematobium]KAH9580281.1 Short integuments 2, mitochondrial [Schistosoma haematobium]
MDGNPSTLSILSDKYVFLNPNEDQFLCIKNYLDIELDNGQGECFLELGIGDGQCPGLAPQEMNQSVCTAERLADSLSSHLIHLRDRWITAGSQSSATTTTQSGSGVDTTTRPSSAENSHSSPHRHTLSSSSGEGKTKGNSVNIDDGSQSKQSSNSTDDNKELSSQNISETNATDTTSTISSSSSSNSSSATTGCLVKEYLLRRKTASDDFVDVRVAVVGNVDAGKSTLLGVLTHGELDNGRGLARLRLLRHKHEAESGRTSSVAHDILGFSSLGQVVNKPVHGHLNWSEICEASAKVITFIDLAGHERYLKTTIFGMTGHAPDYVMFMVGANAGVIGMAKEHLGLALALCVPVFVVVTKIDMCPPNVLHETMNLLFRILKSPGCRKIPALISSTDDVICCATNFTSERMCPIFPVSNVNGTNLDLLKLFLNLLPSRSEPRLNELAHFQIDEIFSVQGVGTVISGTCLSGIIKLNDILLLGPDLSGQFNPISIKSIQRKRLSVNYVRGGQTASFALKKLRRNQVRKGMVLLAPELKPKACIEFIAEVLILHHPTTISVGYQAMVHAGPVRQTATILKLNSHERLRTGDKDMVVFRFIKSPEYLYTGLRLIFREGKTKAVGTVKELVPYSASIQQNPRAKLLKRYVISRTNQPMNNTGTDEIKASSNISSLPKSAEYTSTTTNTVSQPDTTELPNIPVSDLLTSDNLNASANSRPRKYHHHRTRKDIAE